MTTSSAAERARHLVGTTMFRTRSGGGVRRYLEAKHRWMPRSSTWRHTLATPIADMPGMVALPACKVPGLGGDRVPLQRRRLARRLVHLQPAGYKLVLAPSRAMRAHLRDWGLTRVAHQTLGDDSRTFVASYRSLADVEARARARAALGVDAGTRLLIYTGRFAPEKNLSLLAQADGFVHAGDQETFGLSALEAMVCGTPVVARAIERLADLVDDTARVAVQGRNASACAEAIALLFDDAGHRARCGKAARRCAETHDWHFVFPCQFAHTNALLVTTPPAIADPPRGEPVGLPT